MSGFDRIAKMIEKVNVVTTPITRNTVQFGPVSKDQERDWNTRMTINAIPNQGYRGSAEVFFTRVNLSAMGTNLALVQEAPFTLVGVLNKINAKYGAQLTAEDVTNDSVPIMQNGVVTSFQLSAADLSMVWLGNTQVTLLTGIPDEAAGLATFLNFDAPPLFQ